MTRKEMLDQMNDFELAVLAMLEEDGWTEAYHLDRLTPEQKDRFNQIKGIFLEEQLKDCKF